MKRILVQAVVVLWTIVAGNGQADVGDPTLRTDHSHYPGEGAFQTVEDCVQFAVGEKVEPQQQALALFHWLLTHQFHLHSPQEWNIPGKIPGEKLDDYEMVVYDANRGRFSYGYGLCGTVHAWNEPYWRALGMAARRRAFPGHVNSEVEYGGGWHAFDTDMAGLLFRRDGTVAGYDDIAKDLSLVRGNDQGIVCYPFAWPGDFETMKKGWEQVARGGHWYSMYNGGYAGLPGIVHLRRGETFTRHYDRDVFGGPEKRRFWHVQKNGPFRNWTFVNMGEPQHAGEQSNCRGNASYANAVFLYEPPIADATWSEGILRRSNNLTQRNASLTSTNAEAALVVWRHFSPYVICGDPVDDTNPMTGKATDGFVVRGASTGRVHLEVSTNEGQSWQSVGPFDGEFQSDVTELVKGRYGWQARFTLPVGSKLSRVAFETTCQMNQAMYPRLSPGGSQVQYRAASRGVVVVRPDLGRTELEATRYEVTELRSSNLRFTPRSSKQRTAWTTTNNKPGVVVYRVEAPAELVELTAAARYTVRSPQPDGCDFRLDLSTDNGNTWETFARAPNAADNEFSSGWVFGRVPLAERGLKQALVRVHLHAGGYPTGLIDFEAYGIHRTAIPDAVDVAWAWRRPGQSEVEIHSHAMAAGTTSENWSMPTPERFTDAWVRIQVRP